MVINSVIAAHDKYQGNKGGKRRSFDVTPIPKLILGTNAITFCRWIDCIIDLLFREGKVSKRA